MSGIHATVTPRFTRRQLRDSLSSLTHSKTLKREVKEEVGIDIEDEVRLVYTSSFTRVDGAHVVNLTFLCKYKAGKAKALEETAEVRWFSLDELKHFNEAPDFLKREIKALIRFLERYEK